MCHAALAQSAERLTPNEKVGWVRSPGGPSEKGQDPHGSWPFFHPAAERVTATSMAGRYRQLMAEFTIAVPSDVLADLRSRLRNTRYTSPSAAGWEAGTDPAYLRSLLDYWAHDFDWPAAEARLKATRSTSSVDSTSCTCGAIRRGHRCCSPMGGRAVSSRCCRWRNCSMSTSSCPRCRGFLYSELPQGPATRASIAEAFHLLTETLGYERYFAFGGDIGGVANSWLAAMHPEQLAGLHMIHGPFPADFDAEPITPEEQAFFDAEARYDELDAGYSEIMGTRPDTIAAALADSPAGLAAWIIDKYRAWSDCSGDLESRFDKDTLCTILTLYWATECIGTSFRQYRDYPHNSPRPTITVPVAVTLSHEPGWPASCAPSPNGPPPTSATTRALAAAGIFWRLRSRPSSPTSSRRLCAPSSTTAPRRRGQPLDRLLPTGSQRTLSTVPVPGRSVCAWLNGNRADPNGVLAVGRRAEVPCAAYPSGCGAC